MGNEDRVFIKYEKAVEMLPNGDDIHTFRSSGGGMLLGADWEREALLDKIQENKIELSGPMATGMGHGIVLIDDTGPLFIATKRV